MLKITFDSVTWQLAAAPDRFRDEADIEPFREINSAIAAGTLSAAVPETIFTFDAIRTSLQQRSGRDRPLASKMGVTGRPDGTVGVSRSFAPALTRESSPDAGGADGWDAARQLGWKILHCSRLAMTTNPRLASEWFVDDSYGIAKRFGECSREIAANGCGFGPWEALEEKYPGIGQPWNSGAAAVPASAAGDVAKAAAEWADADTVAAHYAYGNDYLCVRDVGEGDGAGSVLSAPSRASLASKYAIRFLSARELAAMIPNSAMEPR